MCSSTVRRYLNEQGIFPTQKETLFDKQLKQLKECKDKGLSLYKISKEMGITMSEVKVLEGKLEERLARQITKADEMELAWNVYSTTEIVGVVGRQRLSILEDQHQTSSILRHNPDLLQQAVENEGDIRDYFIEKA